MTIANAIFAHLKYIKEIKEELLLNGFETHNKTVKCWRIDHTYGNITVRPEIMTKLVKNNDN